MKNLKNKKVILVGLGRLGGGVEAAKYFASQGAQLTITDAQYKDALADSLAQLKKFKNITYKLGAQGAGDFKGQEIAVFNQAVPAASPLVKFAKKHCKEVHNDLTYFLSEIDSRLPSFAKGFERPRRGNDRQRGYIGVTGTRGKTTTATWIGHFLKPSVVGGNMPENGLFKILSRFPRPSLGNKNPLILELSSFELEYMRAGLLAPHIAVITNLHQDHLNRHGTMREYLRVKANLFKYQTKDDFLILNLDNPHTKEFLKLKPKAQICFVSLSHTNQAETLYVYQGTIVFLHKGMLHAVGKVPEGYSPHMQYNLLASLLAAHLAGKSWAELMKKIPSLPQIPFRQELLKISKYRNFDISIYNDSASTSPEGAIAAIERFASPHTAFIMGGTDKLLDFTLLARAIKKSVPAENLFLLEGSGTKKLISAISETRSRKFPRPSLGNPRTFGNLEEIVRLLAKNKHKFKIIVFSPGAASFEKFKNEFDRGREFTRIIEKYFR
jgi:UDP-N-acetylmuramoylalanine--D-glutamate ligase